MKAIDKLELFVHQFKLWVILFTCVACVLSFGSVSYMITEVYLVNKELADNYAEYTEELQKWSKSCSFHMQERPTPGIRI